MCRELPARDTLADAAAVAHAADVPAELTGSVGAAGVPDGRMVDEAMAAEAWRTLRLRRED